MNLKMSSLTTAASSAGYFSVLFYLLRFDDCHLGSALFLTPMDGQTRTDHTKKCIIYVVKEGLKVLGVTSPRPPTTPKQNCSVIGPGWEQHWVNMRMRWWTSPSLGQRRKASWTVCQSFSKPRQGFDRQSRDFESRDCDRTEFFLLVQEFGNFKFNSPGLREGHPHSKVSFCVLLRHVWPLLLCSVPSASETSPEGCSQDKSG